MHCGRYGCVELGSNSSTCSSNKNQIHNNIVGGGRVKCSWWCLWGIGNWEYNDALHLHNCLVYIYVRFPFVHKFFFYSPVTLQFSDGFDYFFFFNHNHEKNIYFFFYPWTRIIYPFPHQFIVGKLLPKQLMVWLVMPHGGYVTDLVVVGWKETVCGVSLILHRKFVIHNTSRHLFCTIALPLSLACTEIWGETSLGKMFT